MAEILAPAGDKTRMEFAFLYGADAIYFGGQNYSLRANAKNFSLSEIEYATKYAHNLNKKVYVTVNTLVYEDEIETCLNFIDFIHHYNVDAILVQDLGILDLTKMQTTNAW